MKTLVPFLAVLFLLVANSSFAQERKTVFESAKLTKSADGASCMNLSWKKGSENTAYYLVQRSDDGVKYRTIAMVFASEDSNFSDYAYRDKSYALAGHKEVYYRIAIVSEQKELTYLPVIKTAFADATAEVSSSASGSLVNKD